mmetsp:Transcript_18308/g.36892  ORF Transcript_18308/g.36892 Transcript_18308/m.36892 type:complete len:523 (+) Transcript_18308:301-1869(+)|eukprot:CAMPEP_0178506914 /NCGR_PEP_ID=MMETSP0696-20121128/19938_1 /TAXON_ID=265572 /ORGANISM="Extubocellulus spinifer, Strain CCMP396" /LENGTH=522 /DNA_ID=CAMNT_0020136363 /DNA_START=114 /DNA_END=1682 /DNA_ORIENTATION=-
MATSTGSADAEDEALVQTASSYCASNGILMGARDKATNKPLGANIYEPAPFSLHPTLLPKAAFEKAYDMAVPFNNVVHRAASQYQGWLRDAVKTAAEGDKDFTGKMLKLADDVVERGRVQNVALGLLRSDYMLHCDESSTSGANAADAKKQFDESIPLQVELNTIASSFGCLSSKITRMHQHIESLGGASTGEGMLPDNGAAEGIAEGLAVALKEYERQRIEQQAGAIDEIVVVMVVQPGETNSVDQRDLEFLLQQKHGVRLIRRSLYELATTGNFADDSGEDFSGRELIIPDGDKMVAAGVVYYRAGYTPNDYPTEIEWDGRGKVEHSSAIKCPDIFYHVFGTKKVQQVLAEPNNLRQFCESDEEEELLSSSFAGLYALGEGDDSAAVEAALANPRDFVLKPQREGGGNNLYDDDLVKELKSMSYDERGAFILMQKIMPPSVPGKLVRGGEIVYEGPCVCELGVFGITLRRYDDEKEGDSNTGDGVILNKVVGHILRSKSVQTDEGGVAAGYAFLSSPRVV